MASNYSKSLFNQYQDLLIRFEEQQKLLKDLQKTVKSLNTTIDSLNETILKLQEEKNDLENKILEMKSKKNRDSSNSSKPSSTNGYKKVPTNNREKSKKSKGGQPGHTPHSLNNKLEQFINSGNVEEEIIEVNKNEFNKNKRYIEKVVIDIEIKKTVKRYRYYPDESGKYNIPKCHNQNVQYGNFVKTVCVELMNHLNNSTDGVTKFIEDITNGGITLSKGTLILWNELMAGKLSPEIVNIEDELMDSYYINADEANIKVDGDNNNILDICNATHNRLWISKHKSQDAVNQIGFLPKYKGIIVKDGTDLYNPYGIKRAQCIVHITRYLKPYFTDIKHVGPKEMYDFLNFYNADRKERIKNNIDCYTKEELEEIYRKYDDILDKWEQELRSDVNNYLFNDEYCLWRRLKYDNTVEDKSLRGDRHEITYFLEDFLIPSTNNPIERAHRPAKIKQKIGKWRSMEGAQVYADILSCINTYKRNKVNVFNAFKSALENNPVII